MAKTAFGRQIDILNSRLSGEGRRQLLINTAKSALADALDQNTAILGVQPTYETVVDGRQGASVDQVRPGGTIAYLFNVGSLTLKNAVDEAFRILAELSPVKTGRYQRSFRLLVNDVERDADLDGAPVDLAETDVVAITNLQPYSRKIERGWSEQAPNGVVEVATAAIKAKYGRLLRIGFSYDAYPGFEVGEARRGGRRSTRADEVRASRYPTMTLRVK